MPLSGPQCKYAKFIQFGPELDLCKKIIHEELIILVLR
jgi:hypothetical protein